MKKGVGKSGMARRPRYEERMNPVIGVREAWAEIDLDDAWTVAIQLVEQAGRLVCAEVRIFPTLPEERSLSRNEQQRRLGETRTGLADVPAGGMRAGLLRDVQLQDLLEQAYQEAERAAGVLPSEVGVIAGSRVELRGRKRRDPDLLARVAILYAEAVRAGNHKPIQYIRERIPSHSESAIRKFVQEARVVGFLTAAPRPGVAGGDATDAAYRALRLTPP